jgi:large subunit ribosomal protein L28
MSKVCEVSGKKTMFGHKVSHSNRKSNRRFQPNLQKKRFFIPEENRWVELKISTSALRTVNKNGITAVLREARKKGMDV